MQFYERAMLERTERQKLKLEEEKLVIKKLRQKENEEYENAKTPVDKYIVLIKYNGSLLKSLKKAGKIVGPILLLDDEANIVHSFKSARTMFKEVKDFSNLTIVHTGDL